MNFSELLSTYIGCTVEVFLANQFYTGVLTLVEAGFFKIEVSIRTYYSPPVEVSIVNSQVKIVRVLL
jgi:hypothetical protein